MNRSRRARLGRDEPALRAPETDVSVDVSTSRSPADAVANAGVGANTGSSRRAFLVMCGGLGAATAGCLTGPWNPGPGSGATRSASATPPASDTSGEFEFPADHCDTDAIPADPGPLEVGTDSRDRFGCAGVLLDGMEDLEPWATYDGILEADVDRRAGGSQSASLQTVPSGDRVWVYRRFDPPLDLRDHDLSVAVHPGRGEAKATMLRAQVLAPDYSNRVDMRHGVGKLGGWFRMDLGPTVVKGTPDLGDVREIRLQSLVGSRDRVSLNVDELRVVRKADRGRVMLTFDDIPISQYTNGFPVMEEYGFPGVAGAIPWLTSNPDYISTPQLQAMQDAGWDIVSHPQLTDPSTPLPTLPPEMQAETLERSKRWLVDHGFERGARFVIWPFHAASATTLDLASRYHTLGFAGGRSPSGIPPTDPLTIGRVDGENLEDTRTMVSFAAEHRQLAVVMYHRIGTDRLSVSDFERTLEFIDRADVTVMTASDLWMLMNR